MNKIYFAILLTTVIGCTSNDKPKVSTLTPFDKNDSVREINNSAKRDFDFKSFFNCFENIKSQPVIIKYDGCDTSKQSGNLLDKKYYRYIAQQLYFWENPDSATFRDTRYYAFYKIDNLTNHIALILGHPSRYCGTMVSLLLFDKKDSSLTRQIELADEVGDAGMIISYKSWLQDFDGDKKYDIVKSYRYQDFYDNLIKTHDDECYLKGIQIDSIFYYKGESDSFNKSYVRISIDSIHTFDRGSHSSKFKSIKQDTIYFSKDKKLVNFKKYEF